MTNFLSVSLKMTVLLGLLLPALGSKSIDPNSDRATLLPSLTVSRPDHPDNPPTPPAKKLKDNQLSRQTHGNGPVKVSPDPIRFSIQYDKQQITIGEEVSLTITAHLLNVSPNQLFLLSGANDYTLKLLLPPGFEQTGGDFTDYVAGHLSYPSQPIVTYRIRGRFRSVTPGTSFRLLRSHGQANDQSLFTEKSILTLQTGLPKTGISQIRKAAAELRDTQNATLYVVTENKATGAARAAAPDYVGYLDQADCNGVSGWIVDGSNPGQSQEVDIYLNGVKVSTVLADQPRRDIASVVGTPNFNEYGYVWVVPDYYKSNVPLLVSVRPANASLDLKQSPQQTAVCPGTGPPPATTPPVTTPTTPPVAPTTNALTMLAPTYNCETGAITFITSGGDGTPIRYRAVGITGWTTNPNQYVDAGARVNADTPPFTIYVEQSGRTITYVWSRQAACSGTPPPVTTPPVTPPTTPPVTPPVTTPTPVALAMLAPTYNCETGAITFNTSGGDGTPIRYRSPGITGWTTNPNQYVDAGSRVNADTPPFTIYAEQSGRTITYIWSRQAACIGTPPVTPPTPPITPPTPPTTPPTPPVTPPTPPTPPVAVGACASGINTINYAWDGGNNSITIRINASAGNPQLKLSGPTNIDWTNTFNLGSVWYWASQGMNTGAYTLSVRQAGEAGAGCSFSFSVPSTGGQLYPAGGVTSPTTPPSPGCTPPSAPVLSAPGGTQVCNNSTVTLTAAGCSGTVTWSGGQTGSSIGVGAAGTYSATCTLNGCTSAPSNQVTVTACANTGNGRYNRVLYVGNSITLHGGSQFFIVNAQNPKRGMAATSPDKDYVRLMSAKHRELNQSVDNRTLASWNMGGQLDEATGPYWEGNSTKNGIDLSRFDPVTAWKPDLVYIRLGENVTDEEITNQSLYQNRLKELIDKLIAQSPGAKVVLSTSVWGRPNYDQAIRAVAAERNYPIADFSDMWPNRYTNGYYALNPSIYGDAGTDNHPDDDGMAHMANKLWDATPR